MMDYLDRVSYTKLATNAGKDLWYKTTWKHESEAANHQEYEMYSRYRTRRNTNKILNRFKRKTGFRTSVKSDVNGVFVQIPTRIENG